MTELKEKKLYPSLPDVRENPSAPAIDDNEDRGHSHRLKIITNVLNFLEKESSDRGTVCVEVAAAVLLSTGVGSPAALGLGAGGAVAGAFSLFGNIVARKTTIRAESI